MKCGVEARPSPPFWFLVGATRRGPGASIGTTHRVSPLSGMTVGEQLPCTPLPYLGFPLTYHSGYNWCTKEEHREYT